ncbi:hypothetical protein HDU96_004951 [Phlyctochytrium bullatum]|nr:hypothetical protein HDU96_004951 [Phlyctochytrium bullatum]
MMSVASGVEAELLDSHTAAGREASDAASHGDPRVDQRYLRFLPGHSATVNTSGDPRVDQRYLRFLPGHSATVNTSNDGHLVSLPGTANTSFPIRSPAAADVIDLDTPPPPAAADVIDLDTPPPPAAADVIDLSLDSPAPSAIVPAAVRASNSSDWTEEMIITCLQLGDDKIKSHMTWRTVAETFYSRYGLRFTDHAIRNKYRLFSGMRDERERARMRRAARRHSLTEPYSGSTMTLGTPPLQLVLGVDDVAPAQSSTRRITRSLSRPVPQEHQAGEVNRNRRILEFGDAKARNSSLRWTDLANVKELRRRERLPNGMTAAAGGQWTHELKQRVLEFGEARSKDPTMHWDQLAEELYLEHGFLRSAKNVADMYRKLKRFRD